MAAWLWVTNLDAKNDWVELKSFTFGTSGAGSVGSGTSKMSLQDAHLTFDPGRFRMRFYNWVYKGEARTAYVFFDPQTEYQFVAAIATAVSTSGQNDIMSLSINFERVKVEHSGAP